MKNIAVAAALLFASPAVFAQFTNEARDLRDAQRLVSDLPALLKPALQDAEQTADTLTMLSSVHQTLVEEAPLTAVDKSLKRIDEFIERAEKMNQPLSRENQRTIKLVRDTITDTKLGPQPPDLLPVREKIHHEYLTMIQRRVLANQFALHNLRQLVEQLGNLIERPGMASAGALTKSVSMSRP
ncbi:MAG TPA: hypothetical protein VJ276_20220 [Thermoanaerobaculia bacterium]|nr:hypothetical protein [Thermoanaerobaculia bacterium]